MKRLTAIFLFLAIAGTMFAAASNDSITAPKGTWTTSSTPALKVDENFYHNWAATGISQLAFVGTFNGNYKYTHTKFIWDNVADLALGYYWQDLDGDTSMHGFRSLESGRKNDDKIDLTSTISMKMKNAWNMNFAANLKTQFLDGFTYTGTGLLTEKTLISSFMAPGYLTTSLGFEYKKDYWNVALSFLTGKTTFLFDDDVIAAGQFYGVDTTGGRRYYAGLGSYVKFYYKKDIAKNLNLYTRVELFYDYTKPNYRDGRTAAGDALLGWPSEMLDATGAAPTSFFDRNLYTLGHDTDLDFEFKLEYRFSSFLAAYFTSRFKYDSDFTGMAPFMGRDESRWQYYQGAGVQVYFNWKTPHTK